MHMNILLLGKKTIMKKEQFNIIYLNTVFNRDSK